jgi:hypothetical protein
LFDPKTIAIKKYIKSIFLKITNLYFFFKLGLEFLEAYVLSTEDGDLTPKVDEFESKTGIQPDGAILIRPDGAVGWRSRGWLGASAVGELRNVLVRLLATTL